jgi:ABC-2 type transport system ATP-binding protein
VIIDHGRTVATGSPAELKRQIGGDVIELHARRHDDLSTVAEALRRLGHGDVQIDRATRRLSVGVDSGGDGLMKALRSVEATGVELNDIALRQPNLDEVFLALTGAPIAGSDAA